MVWNFSFYVYLLLGTSIIGCQQTSNNTQVLPPTTSINSTPSRPPTQEELYIPYPKAGVPESVDTQVNKSPAPAIELSPIETDDLTFKPNSPLRDWKFLVIHHTASEQGSVDSINQSHLQRKDAQGNPWKGIGYHFVIGNGQGMTDGEIQPTFRWLDQITGAHAGQKLYNESGIGICLVGNFELTSPSPAQLQSVKLLVTQLSKSFDITQDRILGHGAIKPTECPGKLFPMDQVNKLAGLNLPEQTSMMSLK